MKHSHALTTDKQHVSLLRLLLTKFGKKLPKISDVLMDFWFFTIMLRQAYVSDENFEKRRVNEDGHPFYCNYKTPMLDKENTKEMLTE